MTAEQVSLRFNRVLEADVFALAGFEPITAFFSHWQNKQKGLADQGDRRSQISARLLGRLYPDVFPGLTNTEPLTLVDPRKYIHHPLCDLALDVQKYFKGRIFFQTPADHPSVIILTDSHNRCGHLPMFIDSEWPDINQILLAGQTLPTIHQPVEVTITGLREISLGYVFQEHWVPSPAIKKNFSPLDYLSGDCSPSRLGLAMVNALRKNQYYELLPPWSRLTLSCPPIEKTWSARRGLIRETDQAVIRKWSYQELLNSISLISTQRALEVAKSLSGSLPEITLMMFLANHAQIITANFFRLTKF